MLELKIAQGGDLCTSFGQGHWDLILPKQVLQVLKLTSEHSGQHLGGFIKDTCWGFSLGWERWVAMVFPESVRLELA